MPKKSAAGRIARAWGAGVRELPSNTTWLLSKALTPLESTKDIAAVPPSRRAAAWRTGHARQEPR